MKEETQPLLEVRGLTTHLVLKRGVVRAVDGVDLTVREGETVGLIGESGSGKTMTCLSILRLLPQPAGRIVAGRVYLQGQDLLALSEARMEREIRGRKIAMISQDPLTSLNPVFTVGDQVGGPFRYHARARDAATVRDAAIEVLERVRIPSPARRLGEYPHQFSGGMRQRVVTAMAIACSPCLLIADEPTSSLDVTIQAQIMELLREIQAEINLGLLLITHDLGVAAGLCHRLAVLYAGRVVESGDAATIYHRPAHPYTRALLKSVPRLGSPGPGRRRLPTIPGQPPSLLAPPAGCRFAPRCPERMPVCDEYPGEREVAPGHRVSCWLGET